MPKVKTTAPAPSRNKGERNIDLPLYLNRLIPAWSQPEWLEAKIWRRIVASQPIATICRETLLDNVVALDWCIEPRDSSQRDELKPLIKYYTKLFENTGDYDYPDTINFIGADALDIPFGSGTEVGREGDSPDGKVLWIELLDGATLFPTLNKDYPVGQRLYNSPSESVYFPAHAINRLGITPRRDIEHQGWYMPPPEKIYLALEALNRGDVYYANLLLDTPQVGILDLLDMSKDSADNWIQSWRALLTGVDPFKIPVLYEHEHAAQFIPFQKNPTELLFDRTILKYAAIVCAGYGMGISDIGLGGGTGGGDTLAGSIRSERKTRKTGFAVLKKKIQLFFNRLLPPSLYWKWIDLDDELSVSIGRARLASATAAGLLIDKRAFTPNEMRLQLLTDGIMNISVPEKIEGGDEFPEPKQNVSQERPGLLGKPIAPSQGGYGEVRSDYLTERFNEFLNRPELTEDDDWTFDKAQAETSIFEDFGLEIELPEFDIRSVFIDKSDVLDDNSLRNQIIEYLDGYLDEVGKILKNKKG